MVLYELLYIFPGTSGFSYNNSVEFKYAGFEWVPTLSIPELNLLCAVLAISAFMLAIGLFYRVSTLILFFSWNWYFLMDMVRYNNHWYLMSLIIGVLIFIPTNSRFSIDSLLRPAIRTDFARRWQLLLIQFHLGIAYFYGGIAKLNHDWLHGQPMTTWLRDESREFLQLGGLIDPYTLGYVYSYGGLLFDLLIVPLLLYRKTRTMAFIVALLFHVNNIFMFSIGAFPYMMILATTMFFDPNWPKQVFSKLIRSSKKDSVELVNVASKGKKGFVTSVLCFYVIFQLVFPLRHFLFEGSPSWTNEGQRFAWRMMLRAKDTFGMFVVKDPQTGKEYLDDATGYFGSFESHRSAYYSPEMILLLAHHIRDVYRKKGIENVEVYAKLKCSLNFRKHQHIVDPDVNLAQEKRQPFKHYSWIVPLTEELP